MAIVRALGSASLSGRLAGSAAWEADLMLASLKFHLPVTLLVSCLSLLGSNRKGTMNKINK